MKIIDYNLKNKYALVTGGSHGIGLAIAQQLAENGCNIAIFSRSEERLNDAKNKLKLFGTKILPLKGDALSEEDCDLAMDKIISEWGTLDILINNVGGGGRWGKEIIEETDIKVWKEVFHKNALAAAIFIKRSIPLMREKKWGRVITITSILGKEGGGRPWFNMSKSAEVATIKSLSMIKYLVRDGLTFNSVAPGGIYIKGAGFEDEKSKNPESFKKMIDNEYPLGRMGEPDEVANLICFLCSDLSSLINGSQIVIDGGQTKAY